jgi:hypothetical protein
MPLTQLFDLFRRLTDLAVTRPMAAVFLAFLLVAALAAVVALAWLGRRPSASPTAPRRALRFDRAHATRRPPSPRRRARQARG